MAVEETQDMKSKLAQLTEMNHVDEVHIKDGEALIYHSHPVYDILTFGLAETFPEVAGMAERSEVELQKVYGDDDQSKIKVGF